MARQRNKDHRGLPKGWRFKNGAYRYRVPAGQEHRWDNKTEFRLGTTLSEAHHTFAGRIASGEGAISTIAQLLDRYSYEVTPSKSSRMQIDEVKHIKKLRELVGHYPVAEFKPQHAYQVRDHLKNEAVKSSGEKQANRHMAMFPEKRSKMRIPTEQEVRDAMKIAPPMLQRYCNLKLMTGLRRTDLLSLTTHDVKDGYLEVMLSKTEDRTDQVLRFPMADEMEQIVKECREQKPLSKFLFKTRTGQSHLKHDKTASGFDSQWQRWQQKLPKAKRFTERSLRNLVGSQDELEIASERLGHSSTATTKKFYRSNVTVVTPLVSQKES